jgi:hypothetical protein
MWLSLALLFVQDPQRVVPGGKSETLTIYRKVKPGETRVEGLLRRIDCPGGRPVVFNLQVNGKPARYTAPALGSVDFIAHDPNFRGPVQCGGKTPPDRVYLTSKPVKGVEQVIAIEFLPAKSK